MNRISIKKLMNVGKIPFDKGSFYSSVYELCPRGLSCGKNVNMSRQFAALVCLDKKTKEVFVELYERNPDDIESKYSRVDPVILKTVLSWADNGGKYNYRILELDGRVFIRGYDVLCGSTAQFFRPTMEVLEASKAYHFMRLYGNQLAITMYVGLDKVKNMLDAQKIQSSIWSIHALTIEELYKHLKDSIAKKQDSINSFRKHIELLYADIRKTCTDIEESIEFLKGLNIDTSIIEEKVSETKTS